jgi:hypothetical protein
MTDQSWIADSVARLDALEQARGQLVAQGRTVELAEVDEEIRTLYEVLESVAEQEDSNDVPDESQASPFAASTPVQFAPGVPQPIAPTPSQSFSVTHVRRSRTPVVAATLILLVAAGTGGWWVHQRNHAKADAPAPAGEPKLINAGAIPEDTQEPDAARGGEADRTPGIKIREGTDPEPRRRATTRSRTKNEQEAAPSGRKIDIERSRDPLAGLR